MPENDVAKLSLTVDSVQAIKELQKFNSSLLNVEKNSKDVTKQLNVVSNNTKTVATSFSKVNQTVSKSTAIFKTFAGALLSLGFLKKLKDASTQFNILTNTFNKNFGSNLTSLGDKFAFFQNKSVTSLNNASSAMDVARFYMERLKNEFDLTEIQAVNTLNNIATLLNSLNFDKLSTANIAGELAVAAKNWAEYTNRGEQAEQITAAFAKSLSGEVGELKTLGIVISTTDPVFVKLQQNLAKSNGITLEQAKSLAIVEMLLKKTSVAAGAFNSMTIANQFENIKNTLDQIIASMANDLNPVIAPILKVINSVMDANPLLVKSAIYITLFAAAYKTLGFSADLFKAKQIEINEVLERAGKLNEVVAAQEKIKGNTEQDILNQIKEKYSILGETLIFQKKLKEEELKIDKDTLSLKQQILAIDNTLSQSEANRIAQYGKLSNELWDVKNLYDASLDAQNKLLALMQQTGKTDLSTPFVELRKAAETAGLEVSLNLQTLEGNAKYIGLALKGNIGEINNQLTKQINETNNTFRDLSSAVDKTFNNSVEKVQNYMKAIDNITSGGAKKLGAVNEQTKKLWQGLTSGDGLFANASGYEVKRFSKLSADAAKLLIDAQNRVKESTIGLMDVMYLVPPQLTGFLIPLQGINKILPVITGMQLAYNMALKGASFKEILASLNALTKLSFVGKLTSALTSIRISSLFTSAGLSSVSVTLKSVTASTVSATAALGALLVPIAGIAASLGVLVIGVNLLFNLFKRGEAYAPESFAMKIATWMDNLIFNTEEIQRKQEEEYKALLKRREGLQKVRTNLDMNNIIQQSLIQSTKNELDIANEKVKALFDLKKANDDIAKKYANLTFWKNEDIEKFNNNIEEIKKLGDELGKTISQFKDKILDNSIALVKSFTSIDISKASIAAKEKVAKMFKAVGLGIDENRKKIYESLYAAEESAKVYQEQLNIINGALGATSTDKERAKLLKESLDLQNKVFQNENEIFAQRLALANIEFESISKVRDTVNEIYKSAIGYQNTIQGAVDTSSIESVKLQNRRLAQLSGVDQNTSKINNLQLQSAKKVEDLQSKQLAEQKKQNSILTVIQNALNKITANESEQMQVIINAVNV